MTITIERIREVLDYDLETGIFTWRINMGRNIVAGRRAVNMTKDGYRKLKLDKHQLFEHRIAWALTHGEFPPEYIDHVNRDKTDNRIANLRPATNSQNQANSKIKRHNTSGYKGVTWAKSCRKWQATITIERRHFYLGVFDSPEAAHAAYCGAFNKHFGEYARAA